MVRRSSASAVLWCVAVLAGCGKDPGEPFPRASATPAPVADQNVKDIVRMPNPPSGAKPSASPRFGEPLRPGGDVSAPVEIVRVEPDCRSLEGAARPVAVEVTVSSEGAVRDARVLSSAPRDATKAILDSVRGWRFRPATLEGRPVPVTFTVTFRRCP
jgi:TonB family protein